MSLRGRVAVITGASTGIGGATASLFAKEGAKVVLCARTASKLESRLKQIQDDGGEGMIIPTDVAKKDDVESMFSHVFEKYGKIDIIIVSAGVNGVWAPIEDLSVDDWDHTMGINLRGTFLCIKYAVPYLKRSQTSSIVVISSINGTRTFCNTGASAYSVTKAGQIALVKMLAPELAKYKCRINAVCPGAIDTNIEEHTEKRNLENARLPIVFPEGYIPLTGKQPGKSEDVANTCLFFARDDQSGHITGSEMYVDGGESLIGI
eukprot:TRINITY_DN478_c0_g1_i1.p1 TRINITY_DN478_c0_g1~~TRINITY_DN478_c0_g1_i1.p1  ORF type:complete len:263 (-),score=71.04 TRINITY_DN478_c0_g1_i1:80-868(-)